MVPTKSTSPPQTPWLQLILVGCSALAGVTTLYLEGSRLTDALASSNYEVQQPAVVAAMVASSHQFDRKTIMDELVAEGTATATPVPTQSLSKASNSSKPSEDSPASTPTPVPTKPKPTKAPEEPKPAQVFNTRWPLEIQKWSDYFLWCEKTYGLSADLVAAVSYKESWFPIKTYPQGYSRCPDGPSTMSCTSSAGAIGVMQVMPFHARVGENLRDPATNFRKGCSILKSYIGTMGSIEGGLAAYNAGPGGANRGVGWTYSSDVLKIYSRYKQ